MSFADVVEVAGQALDGAGVIVLVAGALWALASIAYAGMKRRIREAYRPVRQQFGRSILLGLEVLVAADIIRTVAIEPTLESVAVLAGIVLVRTFLSFSLEVELEGALPWRRRQPNDDRSPVR